MSFAFNCVCVMSFLLIDPVYNAPSPRHRNRDQSSTTFDQKQTGDYNVQVHLKDFHIFAVLGDEPWGSLGDYDYNYDYADLTVKPILPVTSEQPPASSSILPASSTLQSENSVSSVSTPEAISTSKISDESSSTEPVLSSTTPKSSDPSKSEPVTNISLIPVKIISDGEEDHPYPLGEILHYKKCSDGYSRDAQGRCRKITRKNSQLPFGISRLASSLASKIRQIGSTQADS